MALDDQGSISGTVNAASGQDGQSSVSETVIEQGKSTVRREPTRYFTDRILPGKGGFFDRGGHYHRGRRRITHLPNTQPNNL